MKTKVLVTGGFGFEHGEATAGDLMAAAGVRRDPLRPSAGKRPHAPLAVQCPQVVFDVAGQDAASTQYPG